MKRSGAIDSASSALATIGADAVANLVALNRTTGAVDHTWNAGAMGFSDNVSTLAITPDTLKLYAGGSFTCVGTLDLNGTCGSNVGEAVRGFAAAFSTSTGAVDAWHPDADHDVADLAVVGASVYLVGSFACVNDANHDTTCNGADVPRNGVARVNATSGVADAFRVDVAGGTYGVASAVAAFGSSVFIGGDFGCADTNGDGTCAIAEPVRSNILRVAVTGTLDAAFHPAINGVVDDLAFASTGDLWAGGRFSAVGATRRDRLAVLDPASGTVSTINLAPAGDVATIAVGGSDVAVGGLFAGVGGVARSGLAAIDTVTGAATSWNPGVTGSVSVIAVREPRLYVGGSFTTIGGVARANLAALDSTTGVVDPAFLPEPVGSVEAIAPAASAVYVGGGFAGIGGQPTAGYLAALNAVTGAASPTFPRASGAVRALALDAATLYVGGVFAGPNAVGTATRSSLAAIDTASGVVTPWDPAPDGAITAIAVTPTSIVVGGDFGSVGAAARPALAALARADGHAMAFDAHLFKNGGKGSSTPAVDRIVPFGANLIVGGSWSTVNALSRGPVVALDATTGALDPWDPTAGPGPFAAGVATLAMTTSVRGLLTLTEPAASTVPPTIAGSGVVGASLTCDPGTWTADPVHAFEWLRDGTALPGALTATYPVVVADVGRQLTCRVTATTIRGSATATSAAVPGLGSIATALTISGGGTLTYGRDLTIAGRLTDSLGHPAAGVEVVVSATREAGGPTTVAGRPRTGADGHYRLVVRRPPANTRYTLAVAAATSPPVGAVSADALVRIAPKLNARRRSGAVRGTVGLSILKRSGSLRLERKDLGRRQSKAPRFPRRVRANGRRRGLLGEEAETDRPGIRDFFCAKRFGATQEREREHGARRKPHPHE